VKDVEVEPADVRLADDPLTRPFWEAAIRRELLIQSCRDCGSYQFYPRPFCLACQGEGVEWARVRGTGTVYSMTTVRIRISEKFQPPYVVAVVELDEGPRLLTELVSAHGRIGDHVEVRWRERHGAAPLPVFAVSRKT